MDVSRRLLSRDSQDGTVERVSIDSSDAIGLDDGGRLRLLFCFWLRRVLFLGMMVLRLLVDNT